MDGEGLPEDRCGRRNDERYVETAEKTECEDAISDVEEKIGEVEACGVELPEVTVESEGDPVDGAVGEAAGSAKVGVEGYGSEQETVDEGVPVGEGWIVEDLVEVVVDEGCVEGVPIEGEDPKDGDDEEREVLVCDAPLKDGWPGRWTGTECGGAASDHASILASCIARLGGLWRDCAQLCVADCSDELSGDDTGVAG